MPIHTTLRDLCNSAFPCFVASVDLSALPTASPSAEAAKAKPNVVFVFADDKRFDALAGDSTSRTPHLDQLAKEGVFFNQANLTNRICGPSRANIFTGQTPLPSIVVSSGALSITWTKGSGYPGVYGTDFVIETSSTLAGTWTTETDGGNVTLTGNNVTYTFPAPLDSRRFVRLKVIGQ